MRRRKTRGEDGVLILSALGGMLILLSMGLSYMAVVRAGINRTTNDLAGLQVFYVAEAGVEDAVKELLNNTGWTTGFAAKAFENGSYTVSVVDLGNNIREVTSTGSLNGSNARYQLIATFDVSNSAQTTFPFALQAGQKIKFKNAATSLVITGDVDANGSIEQQSNPTINGTVTTGQGTPFPTVDMAAYQAIADTVVNGQQTFQDGNAYAGIWYVKGKCDVKNNVTINGTLICEGKVTFKKDTVSITASGNNPAIVATDDIKGDNRTGLSITGLVFSTKSIKLKNADNSTFNGGFAAGKDIDLKDQDNTMVTHDSNLTSDPPPYFSGGVGGGGGGPSITPLSWK